jgi:hypothetical protein
MARLLEDLEVGTPVYLGDDRVGEVRGVYAEGAARLAEYLAIFWSKRATEVLIPTNDVAAIEEKGVILMGDDARAYADRPSFDEASYPTIRKIK